MEHTELESRVKWIDYKGKKILVIDFSNLIRSEGIPVLHYEVEVLKKISNEKILLLINLTNGVANSEFMKAAKELGKEYIVPKVEKQAFFGLRVGQSVLLKAYNTFTGSGKISKVCATEDEAKEWLVS